MSDMYTTKTGNTHDVHSLSVFILVINGAYNLSVDVFDGTDFIIRYAADGVPLLMFCNADGIFVGILQVGLIGFMNVGGETLFELVSLLTQFETVSWRHI